MAADKDTRSGSFWTSLPGILTGIAAIITAAAGAYGVFRATTPSSQPEPPQHEETPGSEAPNPRPRTDADTRPRFRVIEVVLRADPATYEGPCPATIQFRGRVSVAGGRGTVAYKFLRSDGASAPVQSVLFDGPSSEGIATTWRLGRSYSGWQQVQILDPAEQVSNQARFAVRCR